MFKQQHLTIPTYESTPVVFLQGNRAWSYTLDTTGGTFKNFNPSMKVPNFRFPAAPVFCRRHLVHRHPRGSMPLVWFPFPHIETPVFQRLCWFHRSFKHRTHSLPPAPPSILMNVRWKGATKNPTKLLITKTHRISTTLHTSGNTGKSKASRHKVSAEKNASGKDRCFHKYILQSGK